MKKQLLSILLTIVMVMGLSFGLTITASAESPVAYVECSWDGSKVVKTPKTVEEYTIVDSSTTSMGNGGWYVVQGNVTIESRVIVDGAANLILTDGCKLTVNGGITVQKPWQGTSDTLNIYAQSQGTGVLEAFAMGDYAAGIGGGVKKNGENEYGKDAGDIVVHGGSITAKGASRGAGIGGSGGNTIDTEAGDGGKFTIYDGTVNAIGGFYDTWRAKVAGAGIGGGGGGESVNSNAGGKGGIVTVYGGVVTAQGGHEQAADIGGGNEYGAAGTLKVFGGIVTADRIGKAATSSLTNNGTLVHENCIVNGTVYGSVILSNDFIVPDDKKFIVSSGATLVIPEGVALTMGQNGTLDNHGEIQNYGTLTLQQADQFSGNGTVSGTGNFLIANITEDQINVPHNLVYNGEDQTEAAEAQISLSEKSVTIGGATFRYNTTGWTRSISPTTVKNAGTYTVTYKKANCSVEKTFYVAPMDITGAEVGSFAPMTYSGAAQTPGAEVTIGSLPVTGSWSEVTLVADKTTFTANGNYTGSLGSMETSMAKKSVTAEVVVPNKYWDNTADAEITVNVDTGVVGDEITITGITAIFADKEIGTAKTVVLDKSQMAISGNCLANYTVSVPDTAQADICIIPLTISGVKMNAESFVYGSEPIGYDNTALTISQPGGISATTESLVYRYTGIANDGSDWNDSSAPAKAGNYELTVSHGDTIHYNGTQEIAFTISKAPVTVTAQDQSYHIGTELPEALELNRHYTITGLMAGDSLGTISREYRKDGTVTAPNIHQTGRYDIVMVVNYANSNYEISCIDGTLSYYYSAPTFRPSIVVNGSGEVSIDRKNPEQGDMVTITTDPDKGYEVGTITVTDRNGNEVKVIDNGDGTYTFNHPYGVVNISVTYVPVKTDFSDVSKGSYYYDAVNWAVAKDITNGVTNTTFGPNAVCTRAQAVTFLWRAAGSPAPKSTAMLFDDVSSNAYYHDAVLWAIENGITFGTSRTTFAPNMECTRAQILTFLWRSQKASAVSTANPFVDVAADSYYNDAVLWATKEEITSGTTATTFSPNAYCTRAQIVTFLFRCLSDE